MTRLYIRLVFLPLVVLLMLRRWWLCSSRKTDPKEISPRRWSRDRIISRFFAMELRLERMSQGVRRISLVLIIPLPCGEQSDRRHKASKEDTPS